MLHLLFFALTNPIFAPFPDVAIPPTLAAAQERARTEDKLILIDWYNDWCPACKRFDAYLKRNPEFTARMKRDFVFVKLHNEKGEAAELAQALNIRGWPHFTLYNPHLEMISRWAGFLHVEGFQKQLDNALANRKPIAEVWQDHQKDPQAYNAARLGEYFASTQQHDLAATMFKQIPFLEADLKHYAFWNSHRSEMRISSNKEPALAKVSFNLALKELDAYIAEDPNPTIAMHFLNGILLYYQDTTTSEQADHYLEQALKFTEIPFRKETNAYHSHYINERIHNAYRHSILSFASSQKKDWTKAFYHQREGLVRQHNNPEFQRALLLDWAFQNDTHIKEALAFADDILQSWYQGEKPNLGLANRIKTAQLKLNQPNETLRMSKKFCETYPDRSPGYIWATEAYAHQQDHPNTIASAKQALSRATRPGTRNKARYFWAKAAIASGSPEQVTDLIKAAEADAAYYDKLLALQDQI